MFSVRVRGLSLRIVTYPRQGPFRLGQTVEFTCEVDPVPSEALTYQWRPVDTTYGSSTYSGRSFNKTYYDNTLRFCWYFCSVTHNQTLIGKADKLVEVHGEPFFCLSLYDNRNADIVFYNKCVFSLTMWFYI